MPLFYYNPASFSTLEEVIQPIFYFPNKKMYHCFRRICIMRLPLRIRPYIMCVKKTNAKDLPEAKHMEGKRNQGDQPKNVDSALK